METAAVCRLVSGSDGLMFTPLGWFSGSGGCMIKGRIRGRRIISSGTDLYDPIESSEQSSAQAFPFLNLWIFVGK